MSYSKKLIVKPSSKVDLEKISTNWHGKHPSHKDAKPNIEKHLLELDQQQYLLYAENKRSLLIILQGLDAAGKDGVIRHVLSGMNPQGCTVSGFKQPTPEEISHDFLWRVHPHAPRKGGVSIFNRSHYEDVLISRVHKSISPRECSRRYILINGFEKLLVEENQTVVLKFFLHISKKEQLARFRDRLSDPSRQWKISESDYSERNFWDAYRLAYQELLENTSTRHAPWFVIPSDHKWFRNLAVSNIVANTLKDLKLHAPPASVNLDEIRRKYHSAVKLEKLKH